MNQINIQIQENITLELTKHVIDKRDRIHAEQK